MSQLLLPKSRALYEGRGMRGCVHPFPQKSEIIQKGELFVVLSINIGHSEAPKNYLVTKWPFGGKG
jgi:hypothetical protein